MAWDASGPAVIILDQTRLPQDLVHLRCTSVDGVVEAIRTLAVRGAPAIGAAGALGVALAEITGQREGWSPTRRWEAIAQIRAARPTAVNLAWAVDRVANAAADGPQAALHEAQRIMSEDAAANLALANHGAAWLQTRIARPRLRVLTHCHTGALATCGWGTALGIVRVLHEEGRIDHVLADETRPLLQGARLTAWELQRLGIDVVLQVDSAAAGAIVGGLVDVVVVGADRIAANGDTANKIGTLGLALAAHDVGIPFVVAASTSTVDFDCPSGSSMTIEERTGDEVRRLAGSSICPEGTRVRNPAFDITPARLVSAIVTERGVWLPSSPFDRSP